MRDPDLVQRAERAAIALERAWDRWRSMHGLGPEPSPPVSSYVGYSLEEPWGQPRVVFGVGADEAERLAALLDGHDCVGPIHAEVTALPEWRRVPGGEPMLSARPADEHVSIPAQAPPPEADTLVHPADSEAAPGTDAPSRSASGKPGPGKAVPGKPAPGKPVPGKPVPGKAAASKGMTSRGTARDGAARDGAARDGAARDGAARDGAANGIPRTDGDAGQGADEQHELPEAVMPSADLVPLPPLPDEVPAPRGEAGSFAAAPVPADVSPSPGSGHRGPRYQGSPPQYAVALDGDQRASADAAIDATNGDAPVRDGQPQQRSRARQLARFNRARRQEPGADDA